jgi:hypothetical protein
MEMLEKLKEYLESEKGKKETEEYFNIIKIKKEINNKQLNRFYLRIHSADQFVDFIEKVVSKYNSDKYRNFWYNKGYEPPEILYWFLFDYAEKYGRDCCDLEYETYGNYFTTAMYYINGYYIYRMDGQGSCVQIEKQNN